jgi:hypothetical protein
MKLTVTQSKNMNIFGLEIEATTFMSVWGAILSTVLAFLKIYEYWSNRFRIEVSPVFRSIPEIGNDININNLSSKPVLLEYMELYVINDGKEKCIWSPEDSLINVRIEPYDTKTFNFSEADYFGWDKKPVYIRLYFAGKKQITKTLNT